MFKWSTGPIVITGATATGKTALSVALAQRIGGEIISMDSRQVYRGMDIGTAKVAPALRALVPHYGIDLVTPAERYSAGRFSRDARAWIEQIEARNHVPILAGGTGFFLRALTDPLFEEPDLPAERRERLKRFLRDLDGDTLSKWLDRLDPESAAQLRDAGGRQRISRALELALLTGYPIGWWHRNAAGGPPRFEPLVVVLELPRDRLYAAIDERVHAMVRAGLVEEVRRLLAAGYTERDPGMNATGYIELIPCLRGENGLESAIDAIQRATRRYARRQITWFRHQLPPGVVRLDATREMTELTAEIAQRWAGKVTSENRN